MTGKTVVNLYPGGQRHFCRYMQVHTLEGWFFFLSVDNNL